MQTHTLKNLAICAPSKVHSMLLRGSVLLLAVSATLSGCGDDSVAQESDTTSSASTLTTVPDWQPSLAPGPGDGSGTGELGDDFDPFPTTAPPDKQTSASTTSTSWGEVSTDNTTSSSSGASTYDPTDSLDDPTGSSTGPTGSGSTLTDTNSTDTKGEEPEPTHDPIGPQFGRKVILGVEGEPLIATEEAPYRAVILRYTPSEGSSPESPVSIELQDISTLPIQPRLDFTASGKAAIILPTPPPDAIDPENANRSQPHVLAVYRDINNDGSWMQTEPFVAALASPLIYQAQRDDQPESWVQANGLTAIGKFKDPFAPKIPENMVFPELPPVVSLSRLDSKRSNSTLTKGESSFVPPQMEYLTTMSTAELSDLPNNFVPGPRPLDVMLHPLDAPAFEIAASGIPKGPRSDAPFFSIPGIKPDYMTTRWLVAYQRPLGAPLLGPRQYLTPDSQIVGAACGLNSVSFALWIDSGAWADAPIGAIYAASMNIGEGWGFVRATFGDTTPPLRAGAMAAISLSVTNSCSALLKPKPAPEESADPA